MLNTDPILKIPSSTESRKGNLYLFHGVQDFGRTLSLMPDSILYIFYKLGVFVLINRDSTCALFIYHPYV